MKLYRDNDGKEHINVYSKGKTELGKFLSNFTRCRILTEDGWFNSVEGYWYYLGSNSPDKKKYKGLFGFDAKKIGKEEKNTIRINEKDFQRKIKKAIAWKIGSNSKMAREFTDSTLPFVHYYDYKGRAIEVTDCDWIMDFLTKLREFLQTNKVNHVQGSLFNAPKNTTLGHSCNLQGSWGAGVALEFKKRFKEAYTDQLRKCEEGQLRPGDYHLFKENDYQVLSLFTSKNYGSKSCPPSVINERTFEALARFLTNNPEAHICLPKVNSNLFKCRWEETEVSLRLLKFFFPKSRLDIYCLN